VGFEQAFLHPKLTGRQNREHSASELSRTTNMSTNWLCTLFSKVNEENIQYCNDLKPADNHISSKD
jgi:hypothetical protein